MAEDLLKSLNSAQTRCVTHRPDFPLQILAGPGSGKTKVLTSRIAYMILHHGMDPSSICAVTFTNKAANEMRARLVKLIGKDSVNKVKLGTFHAICALFLRKYGTSVGLDGNFTICDSDESKRIVTKLLKPYDDFLSSKDIQVNAATLCSLISRAKSKGETPEDVVPRKESRHVSSKASSSNSTNEEFQRVFAEIYRDYEKTLRKSNSLDFDDLLLFGVRLFSQHPRYAAWCQHILVDEFQDTNAVQYKLMCCIADASRCVTVVGDPDQSIYGWRSADITNLGKMQNDFPNVAQIVLEQNYRSAGSILATSLAIISQDTSRIAKTLHTDHPLGPLPMLRSFPTEHDEAAFIAWEINRMIAQSGGMLGFGDFAVLLRFNAISRTIENALRMEGIPNRMLGGHQFFERAEIKDTLAYLQLVDNPHFEPAFSRAINIPPRGIGDKSLGEILSRAQKLGISPLTLVERINDSIIPDLKPSVKRKVQSFVNVIRSLRSSATDGMEPAQLIGKLVELIGYQEYLKKSQPDWDTRWENIQELINFASDATADAPKVPVVDEDESSLQDTPLRQFLQASMLSSAGDQSNENDDEKVSIATCHAAKGLEWPVVFVPAVEHGTFPFYRSDDIHEERRLLYVACTRAQTSLYLTHTSKRKVAGVFKSRDLSEFISKIRSNSPPLFSDMPHTHSTQDLRLIAKILDRRSRMPDELEVKRRMSMFNSTARQIHLSHSNVDGNPENQLAPPLPITRDIPPSYVPAFQSVRAGLGGDKASTAVKVPHLVPFVEQLKLVPANPTKGLQSARFCHQAKVESSAQLAVHPRSDRPRLCATEATEATIAKTKRSDRATAGPQLKPKLTPVDLTRGSINHSVSLVTSHRPAKVESSAQLAVHSQSDCLQSPVPMEARPIVTGIKRKRLGMGRSGAGYSNKKFKVPAPP